MTEYTARLDKLISDYSLHLEKQTRDALNPKASAAGSLLRMSFRTVVTGDMLLTKIYREMGWKTVPADPSERVAELAEFAEKNGSLAAAGRLRKCLDAIDRTTEAIGETLPENTGLLKALKAMKKTGVSL